MGLKDWVGKVWGGEGTVVEVVRWLQTPVDTKKLADVWRM